ncbi:MAG: ATP-grasp domain-containing protein, partial [Desulforhabdus sp.]|nr:ATP-grasp domain-containing protein [Desulforhabdus sp.]
MKKDVVFINGWPNSVRPLDTFIPELKDRTILVCSKDISDEYLQHGWSCIPVDEHTWEYYREHVFPRLIDQDIKCVVADSEMHIEPAAHLREALGVPGQTVASARSFRNKLAMLDFLRGASTFRVPRYLKIGTATRQEAETFCADLVNVVVKPIDGTDSKSVRLMSREDFLGEYEYLPHDSFAQEWIDAPIFHVDGLVVRGDLKFLSVAKYFNSCLQYSQGGVVGSEMVRNEAIIGKFDKAIRETLVLMPTPFNTTFHAEFFLDEI